jgi:aconitate hydratase
MRQDIEKNGYNDIISVALVGSCTNSSYEDMSRAASVSGQAVSRGAKIRVPLLVTPGSEMVRATIERDGQMKSLRMIGATVLANACGPCIGQWSRPELKRGEKNTIVTSYNRNFPGRNDGRRETMSFIASPEIVVALALGGNLSFNPYLDQLVSSDGTKFKLDPPETASEVPDSGFESAKDVFVGPLETPQDIEVVIDKNSNRLQKLEPFAKWDYSDFKDILVLAKVKGKCTTDHISPAGPWLMFRGHLDKISDNMLLGGVNAYSGDVGAGENSLSGATEPFPSIARKYKAYNLKWAIIGEHNYGEGSSREHAAMTPRYLGCAVVIAKSFARIHEINLKKQGLLALTFEDPKDYDKITQYTKLTLDLDQFEPGKSIICKLNHKGGKEEKIRLRHSYNLAQMEWFRAGSALNVLRKKQKIGLS